MINLLWPPSSTSSTSVVPVLCWDRYWRSAAFQKNSEHGVLWTWNSCKDGLFFLFVVERSPEKASPLPVLAWHMRDSGFPVSTSWREEGGHDSSCCQSDLSVVKPVGKASLSVFLLLLSPKMSCLLIYTVVLTLLFVSASKPLKEKKNHFSLQMFYLKVSQSCLLLWLCLFLSDSIKICDFHCIELCWLDPSPAKYILRFFLSPSFQPR